MATITLKRTARLLTEVIDVNYETARVRVSEAVNELSIDRVQYNADLRSWEISANDAKRLVDLLADQHLEAIGQKISVD